VKDTQNARPTDSHVGSRNRFRGTDSSSNGNRGEFPSGAGERRPTRVRGRLVLAIAVALFASAFLQGCSGSFFSGPTLGSMFITPAAPMIAASGTTQLVATGMYSDGNQSRISGDNISWSSSDPTVATVTSPGGLVTGVSIGTATITASTTSAIPSSGCSVELSGGGITKTCRGGSSETITATATVNVTEGSE
jgi:hypothetical protein